MKVSAISGITNQHSSSLVKKARKNVLALIAAGGLMLSPSALKAQEPAKDVVITDKAELTEEQPMSKTEDALIHWLGFAVSLAAIGGFIYGAIKIIPPLCEKIADKYGTDETDIFPLDF